MTKLKKFFEFFDDEELRDRHEIEYLTGKIRDMANQVDVNFKKDDINKFISKISYSFPFMRAFTEATNTSNGIKDFGHFFITVKYDEQSKFWNFIVTDETIFLVLGIKILGDSKYDVLIIEDDTRSEDIKSFDSDGVNYETLCGIIAQLFIQSAMDIGFDELIVQNFDDIIVRSN